MTISDTQEDTKIPSLGNIMRNMGGESRIIRSACVESTAYKAPVADQDPEG